LLERGYPTKDQSAGTAHQENYPDGRARCDRITVGKPAPYLFFLVVVWMFVAPIPVTILRFVVLFVVFTIGLVLFRKITSVGAIFLSVPVVIILVL
jgi:hypothetical protein